MADYYPLLVKALETQSGGSPADREAIYGRARAALAAQLDLIRPPLTAAEIERERRTLDEAIARVEAIQPGPAAPGRTEAGPVPPETVRPKVLAADAQGAIRPGRSRRSPIVVAALIGVVAAPMAFLAWTWRGQPRAPFVDGLPVPAPAAQPVSAPKLGERLGGLRLGTGGDPAARPEGSGGTAVSETRPVSPPATARPAPAPEATALAVAQRALLVEEGSGDGQGARTKVGRAVWRLDSVPGGPGLPLETVVRVDADLTEAGFTMTATLRRNTDGALPASHLMEAIFAPAGEAGRSIREIGLPLLRLDEASRGLSLVGRTVPVKENVFLVGLSDGRADVDRNRELLLGRPWIELPIRFSAGGRGLLLIEKGVSGDRLLADAFRIWDEAR